MTIEARNILGTKELSLNNPISEIGGKTLSIISNALKNPDCQLTKLNLKYESDISNVTSKLSIYNLLASFCESNATLVLDHLDGCVKNQIIINKEVLSNRSLKDSISYLEDLTARIYKRTLNKGNVLPLLNEENINFASGFNVHSNTLSSNYYTPNSEQFMLLIDSLKNNKNKVKKLIYWDLYPIDTVQEVAKYLLVKSCKLEELDLTATGLGVVVIETLSESLTDKRCKLKYLNLEDNILGDRGLEVISNIIQSSNFTLEKLSLGFSVDSLCYNKEDMTTVLGILKLLQSLVKSDNNTIEFIFRNDCNIVFKVKREDLLFMGENSLGMLANEIINLCDREANYNKCKPNDTINSFLVKRKEECLNDNHIEVINYLKEDKHYGGRYINLQNSNLPSSYKYDLKKILRCNQVIKHLYLGNAKITDEEAEIVIRSLRSNKLEKLDLSENNLTSKTTGLIAKLKLTPSLKEIDLRNNPIKNFRLMDAIRIVRQNPNLILKIDSSYIDFPLDMLVHFRDNYEIYNEGMVVDHCTWKC